jgi:hypothetical protein
MPSCGPQSVVAHIMALLPPLPAPLPPLPALLPPLTPLDPALLEPPFSPSERPPELQSAKSAGAMSRALKQVARAIRRFISMSLNLPENGVL